MSRDDRDLDESPDRDEIEEAIWAALHSPGVWQALVQNGDATVMADHMFYTFMGCSRT